MYKILVISLIAVIAAFSQTLKMHLTFDEGEGEEYTEKISGLTVQVNNAEWTDDAKFGKALRFNGTDSFVEVLESKDHPVLGKMECPVTIMAWCKPSDFYIENNRTHPGEILSATSTSRGPGIRITLTYGMMSISCGDGSEFKFLAGKTIKPAMTKWSHVAIVKKENNEIQIYVNGSLDGTSEEPWNQQYLQANQNVKIGVYGKNGGAFKGEIDDVRIYEGVMTAEQIKKAMEPVQTEAKKPAAKKK